MNNIVSRNNILSIMRDYKIDNKELLDYINTQNFENEFLLKSILRAGIPPETIYNEFGQDLYDKYISYKKVNSKLINTIKTRTDYVIFTRLKGLVLGLIFALERLKYKFNFSI